MKKLYRIHVVGGKLFDTSPDERLNVRLLMGKVECNTKFPDLYFENESSALTTLNNIQGVYTPEYIKMEVKPVWFVFQETIEVNMIVINYSIAQSILKNIVERKYLEIERKLETATHESLIANLKEKRKEILAKSPYLIRKEVGSIG